MKTTESTGLPTVLNSGNGQKSNSNFIELTWRADLRRVFVSLAYITMVSEKGKIGCSVIIGDSGKGLEVTESYDEVKRLIEEASK